MPSLDWNRRWGSDCAQQLQKQGLRHYGDQWGDPAAPLLRRWLGALTGKARFRNLHRVARDYVVPYVQPGSVCLEIGPGGGRWTQFLVGARELILVDLNPEFFDYLRRALPRGRPAHALLPDAAASSSPACRRADSTVDFVFSFGTFVHIEPDGIDAYLGELHRALRPGGIATLQYADKTKPRGRDNADFSDMNPARMEALAAARGFRIRAHDTTLLLHSSVVVLERERPRSSARGAADQARGVPAPAAQRLDLGVELVDERGERERRAVAARLGEREPEILAHPLDGEAVVELAREHRAVAVLHLPGLRGALRDHLDHRQRVEARGLREVEALGEALEHAGDADLVHHLRELAAPGGPEAPHAPRVAARAAGSARS